MAKPIIKFTGGIAFGGKGRSWIFDVKKHPRLGDLKEAHTSGVQKVTIETLNSIYVWELPVVIDRAQGVDCPDCEDGIEHTHVPPQT